MERIILGFHVGIMESVHLYFFVAKFDIFYVLGVAVSYFS